MDNPTRKGVETMIATETWNPSLKTSMPLCRPGIRPVMAIATQATPVRKHTRASSSEANRGANTISGSIVSAKGKRL